MKPLNEFAPGMIWNHYPGVSKTRLDRLRPVFRLVLILTSFYQFKTGLLDIFALVDSFEYI